MYIMFHNTLALAITTLREIKCTFYKIIVNNVLLLLLLLLLLLPFGQQHQVIGGSTSVTLTARLGSMCGVGVRHHNMKGRHAACCCLRLS